MSCKHFIYTFSHLRILPSIHPSPGHSHEGLAVLLDGFLGLGVELEELPQQAVEVGGVVQLKLLPQPGRHKDDRIGQRTRTPS